MDAREVRVLSVGGLFDGIGLLAYGLHRAGLEHAWLCESDPWRRGILAQRWPGVPVLDDVRAVGADTAVRVDVIAGGFPCKGASTAGKRTGFDHPETVLWREMARAVGELRPRYVVVENVANILALHDGAVWGEVLGDLATLGYDTTWDCLPAAVVGAPHLRDRVFAVAAYTGGSGRTSEGRRRGVERPERAPRAHVEAVADAHGGAGRNERQPESGSCRPPTARDASASAADTDGAREDPDATSGRSRGAVGERGVRVAWGDYEPAIERWEAVHGAAPEPLVRRMDDRSAARVERSRLSALGDGVQVQIGHLVGAYIVELERARLDRSEAA